MFYIPPIDLARIEQFHIKKRDAKYFALDSITILLILLIILLLQFICLLLLYGSSRLLCTFCGAAAAAARVGNNLLRDWALSPDVRSDNIADIYRSNEYHEDHYSYKSGLGKFSCI